MDAHSERYDLFPQIKAFDHGMLALDPCHEMYWEQSGNPDGEPVVFLHGGPGAGAGMVHRRFFDPRHYRIIIFDQRGAGRSRPFAELRDNTTGHLIEDIDTLRRHLGVERWLVFGGSWGATLALAYGIQRPEHCTGFVLRGIFLCRKRERDWFLYGMRAVFPEAWREFSGFLPEGERGDLLDGYHRRLTDADPAVHMPAARAWSRYENTCSTLLPKAEGAVGGGVDRAALSLARIEAHYFRHDMFVDEDFLLDNVGGLRKIPAVIIQGRYDIVCPAVTADELARAWPEAEYVIVSDAGHSAMEPGIRSALVGATEKFKTLR